MSSSRGRDPSQSRYIIYTDAQLNKLKVEDLLQICELREIIHHVSKPRKPDIIASIMLDQTQHLSAASDRGASATGASEDAMGDSLTLRSSPPGGGVAHHYTQTTTARKSPERRSPSASAARGKQREADEFASLTAGSIARLDAPNANALRKEQWEAIYETGHQPWDNLEYLIRAVLTRMMPENPEYVENPVLVVNIGAAGVGKSNGPFALGLSCNQTLVLNPDEWYEFFAIMFGYFPPSEDSEWWNKNRDKFGLYEDVIPSERITRDTTRPVASEFCSPKVHCLSAYSKMLRAVKDFIFEQATDKLSSKSKPRGLNIVFDSTGAMEDVIGEYITMAQSFGYKIVIVGVYSTLKNCIGRVDQVALEKWKFGSEEEAADQWRPASGAQIARPDIPPAVAGDGAASCRNKIQHRKLVAGGLYSAWKDVRDKLVIFKWVARAQENGWRIVLVENNLSSANPYGGVGIIYDDENKEEPFVQKMEVGHPETVSALFRPTGFYGMKLTADGTFVGREEVEKEAAAAAAAAAAAKAKAKAAKAKRSHDGGSSRKRRISRRRIHGSRYRKTIKKYARPVTRHRRHRI
jgi:hypothetical protein